jgi:hypothetical protein
MTWLILIVLALTTGVATQISKSENDSNNLDITVRVIKNPFKALGEDSKDIQDLTETLFISELESNGIKEVAINPDWQIMLNAVKVKDNYVIAPVMMASMDWILDKETGTEIYVYIFSEILESDDISFICRISVKHFVTYLNKVK